MVMDYGTQMSFTLSLILHYVDAVLFVKELCDALISEKPRLGRQRCRSWVLWPLTNPVTRAVPSESVTTTAPQAA